MRSLLVALVAGSLVVTGAYSDDAPKQAPKVVLKSPVNPAMLIEEYHQLYSKKDYHTLYFGEIQECYETE